MSVAHPSGLEEPEGAPGHLVIVVGAGVVFAVVPEAILLAQHVRAGVIQPKVQHLLRMSDQLL